MRDFAKDREPKLLTHGQKAILERMASDVVRLQGYERATIEATLEMNLQAVSLVGSCMCLEGTNEMLQRRIAELEAERDKAEVFAAVIEELRQANTTLEAEAAWLEAENARLQSTFQEATAANDSMWKKRLEEQNVIIESYEVLLKTAQAENDRLKEQLAKFCLDCSRDINNCTCMEL